MVDFKGVMCNLPRKWNSGIAVFFLAKWGVYLRFKLVINKDFD